MELYSLGRVPWCESQVIYHALAEMGKEGLSLVIPDSPYVCIGYHQDVQQEVDLDFCRQKNIPVFRRRVGGGAVYLDGNQLFYQLIIRRDNPLAPLRRESFYEKFLQPVINTYRRIGIPAEYKPVNDVVADGRKLSGTGVGEIGDCIVFVGNLIVDFDYVTMSRVLKIPDEKFRDKVRKTIEGNLSTIRRELGSEQAARWTDEALNRLLAEEFTRITGPMAAGTLDVELRDKMDEIAAEMTSEAWLQRKGKKISGRIVKIRAGLEISRRVHKALGGLIRAEFTLREGRYEDVAFSGDWFCYPAEAVINLEKQLSGVRPSEAREVIEAFYRGGVETPGLSTDDWLEVLKV